MVSGPQVPKTPDTSTQKLPLDVSKLDASQNVDVSQKKDSSASVQQYVRGLNSEDIANTLLALQKPVTPSNKQLVMTMLLHGVEVSAEAFDALEQLTKGKTRGNKLEASVASYSKGLGGNAKAVDLISSYLSSKFEFSSALKKLMQKTGQFKGILARYDGILDPGIIAGAGDFLDDFFEQFKTLSKDADRQNLQALLGAEGKMVSDLRYLQEFLRGLNQGLLQKHHLDADELKGKVDGFLSSVSEFHDVLLMQLVLSKNPENMQLAEQFFHYWMVPNPMAVALPDVELLISKDAKNKKKIDPDNATMVIKCSTNDLGDLTIILQIKGRKVGYKIYTKEDLVQAFVLDATPDLRKAMETLDYDLTGVQVLKQVLNLDNLLLPKLDLNHMTRISTEA